MRITLEIVHNIENQLSTEPKPSLEAFNHRQETIFYSFNFISQHSTWFPPIINKRFRSHLIYKQNVINRKVIVLTLNMDSYFNHGTKVKIFSLVFRTPKVSANIMSLVKYISYPTS